MNKKTMTLAIMSAVLATGLAMSVLAPTPVLAQSASTGAATSNGTAGSASFGSSDFASSASGAGPDTTSCVSGSTFGFAGSQCDTD